MKSKIIFLIGSIVCLSGCATIVQYLTLMGG